MPQCGKVSGPSRRIVPPKPVEFFELYSWDGADGRTNRPTGYIASNKEIADEWVRLHTGASYRATEGILIHRLEDMPAAEKMLARQKALSKLTDEEQKLLGLR